MDARVAFGRTVCPHDCPSTCALEVELLDDQRIGRVRGAKDNSYTAGVVCAKVGRYAERLHHPDRLLHPLKRTGPKGSGQFTRIGWDEALDTVAAAFNAAEREFGAASVWPYFYAGTMGLVMRDGIERLRHVKRYSRQNSTICSTPSYTGFLAGTGRLMGPDPREMAYSDVIVIWGTNPVNTQVNVMTHATRARKDRGAKIVVVDVYRNGTAEQADMALILKPGTDAALACAVMHVLFRDGHADWPYLEKYTDHPKAFEQHLKTRTPEWASAITGLSVDEILSFARLVGAHKNTFFRLGFGFTRGRGGAAAMHAASCIAAVSGGWQLKGGGALHSVAGSYKWDKSLIEGLDAKDLRVRAIDMSRIGPALTGDPFDLAGGPPVKAMIVQSTNPVEVAPEQAKVKAGFARDDLFVAVHEQFMTATAKFADIVIPATMFVEHDDIYQASGHPHIQYGRKLIEPPGECRSNHWVVCELAKRVGARHRGFEMTSREIADWTLEHSGWGGLAAIEQTSQIETMPPFEEAHYLDGFSWPDKKFRFKPDWHNIPKTNDGLLGPVDRIPEFPDHWAIAEAADATYPFRLTTSPARAYLNSSFNETTSSRNKHGAPVVMIHPDDLLALGLADGDKVRIGSRVGEIAVKARAFDGVKRGVAVIESIPPNEHFDGGAGVNTLTSAEQVAPYGGAPFHDTAVWIKPAR